MAMVSSRRARIRARLIKAALLAGAAGALAVLSVPLLGPRCTVVRANRLLTLDITHLVAGRARLYCLKQDAARKIRFVLARGSAGVIYTAFDACRQCYTFHKGYQLVDGALICRLCGNRYPIDHMLQGKASCVPVELPHRLEGNTLKIDTADLAKGRNLF